MKALTLWQPHAALIACGHKPYETRSWGTNYRGDVLITSAVKNDAEILAELMWATDLLLCYGRKSLPIPLTNGCVECVARLQECIPHFPKPGGLEGELGHFGEGRFAWLFTDIRPLPVYVPCRGMQGLWTPPAELVQRVSAAMAAVDPGAGPG